MSSLSQAKLLGGIGSILVLLSIVPSVGWVIAIVGLVLTVIAVKYIGDVVQDASIFKNMIIGIVLAIAGSVVFGVVVIAALLRTLGSFGNLSSLTTSTTLGTLPPPNIIGLALTVIGGLAVLWIFFIISAIFVRKSYGTISQRLDVGMFKTAALIYLIGAIITIVGIGLIIVYVGQILLTVAFFQIPENLVQTGVSMGAYPPPPSSVSPPPPSPTGARRTCPRCGAPVASDSVFCASCGSSLTQ